MRIKTILLFIGMTLTYGMVSAQTTDEMKKEINKIKKNSQYIYAEAVSTTKEDAAGLAEELLADEVNSWAASQKKLGGKAVIAKDTKSIQTALSLPRGNMFRTFIYVKKSDIMALSEGSPATGNAASKPAAATVTAVYPEAVNTIASYTDYHQMAEKIKELKESGEIGHYARYGNLEKPEFYYLVIYNPQGQVVAVLTPGKERKNVKTGQPDQVTNYSGCGAIGFTVK